jgi:hypothetical protein
MAGPIYKLWMANVTEAWHQLSAEEQADLLAKITDCLTQVGGKGIVGCESAWAAEQVEFWGVEEFPDIEAVQKLAQLHDKLNWHRYMAGTTILGTAWQPT